MTGNQNRLSDKDLQETRMARTEEIETQTNRLYMLVIFYFNR